MTAFRFAATASLVALLVHPLPAASVEDRLADLEARLAALSAENQALKARLAPPAPPETGVAVTPAGKVRKLSIGGYLQAQAEGGDAPDDRFPLNNRFLVRRARITLKGSFAEDIDFTFQSEFGNSNLGTTSNYRAQATDAFLVWKKFSFANVTVGQFKTPYGYEQLLPDTKLPFAERSLPNDRLTLYRQIGAMVSGDIVAQRLAYAVGAFNGNGVNQGGNDNESFLTVGRVSGAPVKTKGLTLTTGANGFATDDSAGASSLRREGFGFDAQLAAGRLDSAVEWLRMDSDRLGAGDAVAEGWSAHLGYYLLANKLRAGVRFETYDPDTSAAGDDSATWTLGLNYYLKGDDLKLTLNYLLGDPAGPLSDQGRVIAQAQVVF